MSHEYEMRLDLLNLEFPHLKCFEIMYKLFGGFLVKLLTSFVAVVITL